MPTKEELELAVLEAQHQKLLSEVRVLRRTTPISEALKVIGSLVVGIGGLVVAYGGYQLGEAKSVRFQNEAQIAQNEQKRADIALQEKKAELESTEAKLAEKQALLGRVQGQIETATTQVATLSDASPGNQELKKADDALGAADIDLRSSLSVTAAPATNKTVDQLIEELFGKTASVRGQAYESIMSSFSKDPKLVPKLIVHATANPSNLNGVYNALVVLSHLDHRTLGSDLKAIRAFGSSVESKGPRISERAQKLLERLPKE